MDLLDDNHLKRVLPYRYEMLQEAWNYWKSQSIHDHAKQILIHGCMPGIDDDILLERIKELERR